LKARSSMTSGETVRAHPVPLLSGQRDLMLAKQRRCGRTFGPRRLDRLAPFCGNELPLKNSVRSMAGADSDRLESLVGWAKARSSRRAHRARPGWARFALPTLRLHFHTTGIRSSAPSQEFARPAGTIAAGPTLWCRAERANSLFRPGSSLFGRKNSLLRRGRELDCNTPELLEKLATGSPEMAESLRNSLLNSLPSGNSRILN